MLQTLFALHATSKPWLMASVLFCNFCLVLGWMVVTGFAVLCGAVASSREKGVLHSAPCTMLREYWSLVPCRSVVLSGPHLPRGGPARG